MPSVTPKYSVSPELCQVHGNKHCYVEGWCCQWIYHGVCSWSYYTFSKVYDSNGLHWCIVTWHNIQKQEAFSEKRRKMNTGFWWRKLKNRDNLEDLGIDGRTILIRILMKYDGSVWTGFIWLKKDLLDCCEHGNEPWSFIYCKDCLNYLRNISFASMPVLCAVNWLLCLCVWYDSHKQALISSLNSINTLVGSLNAFWKRNFTVRRLVYITELKRYAGSKLTHCGANHVRQVSRKLQDKQKYSGLQSCGLGHGVE